MNDDNQPNQRNYITPCGFKKLRDEYQQLVAVERPKLVETIAWAASNGDRSENADYIYGKRRLRQIDGRLHFLKGRIELAEIVDPAKLSGTKVLFGATVIVSSEASQTERTYQIVGEDEFDAAAGKISWKSPLARALLGKTLDDEVTLQKPNSPSELLTIIDIKYDIK